MLRDTPTTRVELEDGPAVEIQLQDVLIQLAEDDDAQTAAPPPPPASP